MVGEPDPLTSSTQGFSPTQDSKPPSTRLDPSPEQLESVAATSAEPVLSRLRDLPPDEPVATMWIAILAAFDVVFLTLSLWTFEPLMME